MSPQDCFDLCFFYHFQQCSACLYSTVSESAFKFLPLLLHPYVYPTNGGRVNALPSPTSICLQSMQHASSLVHVSFGWNDQAEQCWTARDSDPTTILFELSPSKSEEDWSAFWTGGLERVAGKGKLIRLQCLQGASKEHFRWPHGWATLMFTLLKTTTSNSSLYKITHGMHDSRPPLLPSRLACRGYRDATDVLHSVHLHKTSFSYTCFAIYYHSSCLGRTYIKMLKQTLTNAYAFSDEQSSAGNFSWEWVEWKSNETVES